MADEQQRPVEGLHRLLDPLARGDVEVVGRLVENEEVHLVVHQHAEPQAALLAAGEHGNRLEHVLSAEVERRQTVARLLRRDVPLGIKHRVHKIALRHVEVNDLRQVGDLRRGAELDAALVGVLLAHDHLDERGFSRTVVADERDALTAGDLEVHAGEQRPLAEGLADALER